MPVVSDPERLVLEHKMEMEEQAREAEEAAATRAHELQLAKLQHRVVERNITIRTVFTELFAILPKCVVAMCITLLWLCRRPVDEKLVKWLVK